MRESPVSPAPPVSVLLPFRDADATLDEAVASVLTWEEDLELLLLDDGSTDDGPGRARIWEARDGRVRVLSLPRRGLVAALNEGLQAARGRYIARMDADDIAAPARLARQLPLLEADPGLAVVDGQVAFFRDEGPVPEGMRLHEAWINAVIAPEDFRRAWSVESPVVHPAATLRRAAVLQIGGYRAEAGSATVTAGPVPEDYDLWLRLDAAGWRFAKVPEVLVHMRDRPARLTRTHPAYAREAFRRARMLWLEQTALREPRRVVLWGAGREGRPWLRWLLASGHRVSAVIDVDPRKIGSVRQGVPVRPPEALPDLEADLCLVAVAARGARAQIRAALASLRPGWREGWDWWALR
ncbi:MAG: glycosyltransferase [Pseudomonadota bacterium]